MTSKKDSSRFLSAWRSEVPVDGVFCEDAYRRVLLKADAEQTPAGDPSQHRALHNLCSPGRLNEGIPCGSPTSPLGTCSLARDEERGHCQDKESHEMGVGSEDGWGAFLERNLGREFPPWWGRGGEDPGASVELKLSGSCKGEMWQLCCYVDQEVTFALARLWE